MTLNTIFSQYEQELLIEALEAQQKKCKTLANAPIRGYGSATEYAKKEQWANKASSIQDLLSKIIEMSN